MHTNYIILRLLK